MNRIIRNYNTKPNKTSFKVGHKKVGGIGKGDKMSDSAKEKIRLSLLNKTGKDARNWQGGKTKEGIIIRYSRKSKEWRMAILKRDDYTCQGCGERGGTLEVDHIKPFAYFPELRFEMSNGRTLCRECHKKTDTYAYKAIKQYATA